MPSTRIEMWPLEEHSFPHYRDVHRDRVILVLDVTKEQMNGAQGFDEAHWPNFSDPNFSGDLHRRYGVEDRWNHCVNRDGKVDVNVDRQGVKIKVDVDRK